VVGVNYLATESKKSEQVIPLKRITEFPIEMVLPTTGSSLATRDRKSISIYSPEITPITPNKPAPTCLQDILLDGSRSKQKKGWRAIHQRFQNSKFKSENFKKLSMLDYKELVGYLSANPSVHRHNTRSRKNNTFVPHKKKHNVLTLKYLNFAWGVGKTFFLDTLNVLQNEEDKAEEELPSANHQSVIQSWKACEIYYSPKGLFIQHRINVRLQELDTMPMILLSEKTKGICFQKKRPKQNGVLLPTINVNNGNTCRGRNLHVSLIV
jgi:hypothetical protein